MKIIKPPQRWDYLDYENVSVFLAGSIEMGAAVDWQTKVEERLSIYDHVVILNPRRDDWDNSQEQSPDNPYFRGQVEWELDMLFAADYIFMYFDPNTISPISLLELGAFAGEGNMMVCCPDGYFRKGNVEIFCEQKLVRLDHTFEAALDNLENLIKYELEIRYNEKEST